MLAGAALSYCGGQVAWITDKPGIDKFEVQERENCWIYWFLWANI